MKNILFLLEGWASLSGRTKEDSRPILRINRMSSLKKLPGEECSVIILPSVDGESSCNAKNGNNKKNNYDNKI